MCPTSDHLRQDQVTIRASAQQIRHQDSPRCRRACSQLAGPLNNSCWAGGWGREGKSEHCAWGAGSGGWAATHLFTGSSPLPFSYQPPRLHPNLCQELILHHPQASPPARKLPDHSFPPSKQSPNSIPKGAMQRIVMWTA